MKLWLTGVVPWSKLTHGFQSHVPIVEKGRAERAKRDLGFHLRRFDGSIRGGSDIESGGQVFPVGVGWKWEIARVDLRSDEFLDFGFPSEASETMVDPGAVEVVKDDFAREVNDTGFILRNAKKKNDDQSRSRH